MVEVCLFVYRGIRLSAFNNIFLSKFHFYSFSKILKLRSDITKKKKKSGGMPKLFKRLRKSRDDVSTKSRDDLSVKSRDNISVKSRDDVSAKSREDLTAKDSRIADS